MIESIFKIQASQEDKIEDLEVQEVLPVVAKYERVTNQTISHNTTTIFNFDTLVIDTHSAVATGASWSFTAPVSGYYHVSSEIGYVGTNTWGVGEYAISVLYKNGSPWSNLGYYMIPIAVTGNVNVVIMGSDIVYLAKGNTIDIRVAQTSGGSLTTIALGRYNYISIHKI